MAVQFAKFSADVTPPVGHPLCGGWYPPARGVAGALLAKGVILIVDQQPIVLCAIDWAEISNRSHLSWKASLAAAVGTTPDRVVVHCTHSHMSPWPDEYAEQVAAAHGLSTMDSRWCAGALEGVGQAARVAMGHLTPVTTLKLGRAKVDRVASNRRVMGADGKVKAVRWTRTVDPAVRAEPEGLIDPWLKTFSLWNGDQKLAALHYYAVHPTSYEDSLITAEFVGLARERRQQEEPDVAHLYFTECAGNITAGKYNDGAVANREIFASRIHSAMVEAEAAPLAIPIENIEWRSRYLSLPPREDMVEADLHLALDDLSEPATVRVKAAFKLAYLERAAVPIQVAALHFGQAASLLHLPAEAFIEYQLFAQSQRPEAMVVVPAYGDCGPGYICLEPSFAEGGYEPGDAFVAGRSEGILKDAITKLMRLP